MKNALQSRFSGTRKFFRRVLSKTSIPSHDSLKVEESPMAEEALLRNELEALKEQIIHLKTAINALQEETEQKEIYIGNLAREKEKITLDLLKTKRSNVNLAQQLEDERKFYFNEKQIYCQEMNECKKLKQILSSTGLSSEDRTVEEYKREIEKLKHTLNQTLQANYNLSIKFLRMKNTKTCLKSELQAMRIEHEKLENEYKAKIENLASDLNNLLKENLSTPISPSNKKYLQLVKQNSCLIYENLCLQLEVDNLNIKVEKMRLDKTKSETNARLKYIHDREKRKTQIKDTRSMRINDEPPEKLEKEPLPGCSKESTSPIRQDKVVKLYERKMKPGVPTIKIVDEKNHRGKKNSKKRLGNGDVIDPCTSHSCNLVPNPVQKHQPDTHEVQINIDDNSKQKIVGNDLTKLSLFQVSDIQSTVSSDVFFTLEPKLSRSYSFPDIAFNSKHPK